MTPISDDMVELPRPLCTYADHSYPAFSQAQMIAYGQACATAALEGSVAVPAWQPIETAPMDGTWLLVWENTGVNTKFSRAEVARYYLGDWQNGEKARVHHASHWRPLPAPPASAVPRQDRLPATKVGE